MVVVPAGEFLMGSPPSEKGRNPDEGPQRKVAFAKPFAVGKYEVTFAQWDACVAEQGCTHKPGDNEWGRGKRPVINVSWADAKQFVAWLAKKTGKPYRLPSEAEWEYAARGNTITRYWWGNEVGVALANCRDCGGNQDRTTPLPVQSFKPNPFGLYDVNGGVGQWVADCWFPNYQGASSDGRAREQKNCQQRVLRGGSFRTDRNGISVAARNYYDASVRYIEHGFRVAAD